jgi:hypothetical protein
VATLVNLVSRTVYVTDTLTVKLKGKRPLWKLRCRCVNIKVYLKNRVRGVSSDLAQKNLD